MMWSHPHSFYNRYLVESNIDKWLMYHGELYNWIEILKLLHDQRIMYYQVKWKGNSEGRISQLPNGEKIMRVKILIIIMVIMMIFKKNIMFLYIIFFLKSNLWFKSDAII